MTSRSSFGVAQAVALGMCIGAWLSTASCGSTRPPVAKCSRNTCTGCCDDTDGKCYAPDDAGVQSTQQCGLNGITCLQCRSGETCNQGQCRIVTGTGGGGGGTGGGNGDATGGGGSIEGTGGGGGASCNATSCSTGCCNASGVCVPPQMQNFMRCGSAGALCASCPAGQACITPADSGANHCEVPSCSACLDAVGNCRTDHDTMTDPNYCGASGGLCARCDSASGQMCVGGRCTTISVGCSASNCDGCCTNNNTCIGFADGGLSNAQCGRNAALCQTCTAPATCELSSGNCVGGGTGGGFGGTGGGFGGTGGGGGTLPFFDGGTCDTTSCASGCCDVLLGCLQNGDDYPPGGGATGIQACGSGGGACKLCPLNCALGMAAGLCL
jgi:hypothetical protein